jgi:hypothetical protein
MHDRTIRALPIDRQGWASGLAAALAALLVTAVPAIAAAVLAQEPATTSSIDRDPAGEVRIQFVKKGFEGLELSARLAEGGGMIERPVFWTVRRAGGELVYQGEEPVAELVTEPGDYDVTARYGTVTVARTIALLDQQRLGVSLVLNVGGLRVLPRIADIGLPAVRTETRVYSTSGRTSGQIVAMSTLPGEIIRLGAGSYRVESRFVPGNASAIKEVTIAPGRLQAVEHELPAGLIRLTADVPAAETVWTVTPESGLALPPVKGPTVALVLLPGSYRATASIGAREYSTHFEVRPGSTENIWISR